MLLQTFFLTDQFFSFSEEFLPLSFVGRYILVIEPDGAHICFDHTTDPVCLFRAVFLEPSAYYVK